MAGRPGRSGRKPRPTALKVIAGERADRINGDEPRPGEGGAPRCPSWLSREGKAEWRRVVPALERTGMLRKVDRAALAAYCAAWARLVEAERLIAEHGQMVMVEDRTYSDGDGELTVVVKPTRNPALTEAKAASDLIRGFLSEFGLSPSSRSRLAVGGREKSDGQSARRLLS